MKTIKSKTLFLLLAIASLSLLNAGAANASCYAGFLNITGVYEYSVNGTPYGYVYAVPEHQTLPTYAYWFSANQVGLTQAKMALQNHQSLYLIGDAATCPTTGSYRSAGTLQYLYEY